ncbi:MAG: hypothetical protein ISEC1_P1043 [Thiomicrorhabdus sp.]|nr:MAG: hypothetical protein ISEC1_P1043 [Thiomicrorhabdus sp.]
MRIILTLVTLLLLSACSDEYSEAAAKIDKTETLTSQQEHSKRWYSAEDVKQGQIIFSQNCASCHGDKAQGIVKDWKQALDNGKYPAPPLNGSAHAWHHPLKMLNRTIEQGGIRLGGTMQGFNHKLTQEQRLQAIAYFQDFWPDKTYQIWLDRDGLK